MPAAGGKGAGPGAARRLNDWQELQEREAQLPPGWPNRGDIEFTDVRLRYREDLPLALTGFTASIKHGEKVGICGRTGAGKSTLALLLFRLFEAEVGSKLILDGVDVATVPLRMLRRGIAIIPQDAVVFTGSLRYNLDPFSQHADKEVAEVLSAVRLGELDIDQPVADNDGSRLSHGQRQLVCIARALLQRKPILVCDEATSSIDTSTDHLIQELLRSRLKDCTVLTVAHRLQTIINNDRVMVMAAGKVAEFATPQELLWRRGSLFAEMANNDPAIKSSFSSWVDVTSDLTSARACC